MMTEPFDVALEQRGDDLWVLPAGDLDLAAAPDFADALSLARSSDAATIVVDLAGLEFLDSTGIGVLVRACSSPDGRRMRLREGPPQVMRALQISGLASELPFERAADGT